MGNSLWIEGLPPVRVLVSRGLLLIGMLILTGCGTGGKDDFACQGLGGYTVSGTVRYEKKLYNNNGYTSSVFIPVRSAPVEVKGPSGLLASTTTDDQGRYCAIYIKSGEPTLNSVRVIAKNAPAGTIQVGFLFDDAGGVTRFATHAISKPFDERQGGSNFTVDMELKARDFAGIFNIRDTMDRGAEFIKGVTGKEIPPVTAVWQEEVGGTFFATKPDCQSSWNIPTDCIFVRGDGEVFFGESFGDRDEFDDDIILHEYGHFIAHNFSEDDSKGGTHYLGDNSQDVRLAWSEGWATFFSSAVRKNPENVDVGVSGEPLFAFSIDSTSLLYPAISPEPLNAISIHTTSEVAVASVLWDVFDELNEPTDSLSLGFGPIWDILGLWRSLSSPPPITMDAFWDSFGAIHPAFLAIVRERRMEFVPDRFENENDNTRNSNRKIVFNTREPHTLYPSGDVDYVAFDVDVMVNQQYTVETLNLKNGADTFLEIEDQDGQPVASPNDDLNRPVSAKAFQEGCNTWGDTVCLAFDAQNVCIDERYVPRSSPACPNGQPIFPVRDQDKENPLPSRIIFIAPTSGTFYAKVSRSPNPPPSAGRYGSYDFRITSP